MTIRDAWAELEQKLPPERRAALRPPASRASLAQLELGLGRALPSELVDSLEIHDGQNFEEQEVFGRWAPLSSEHILYSWTVHAGSKSAMPSKIEAIGPVRAVWWSDAWIPFARDGAGDLVCVDTDPAPGGTIGQVIEVRHDDPRREVLAPDLARWLSRL